MLKSFQNKLNIMNINIKKYWIISCIILFSYNFIFATYKYKFNLNYTYSDFVANYGIHIDSVSPYIDSSNVKLLARAYSDSIVLRMAPMNYSAFVNSTKKGIQIKRSIDNKKFENIALVFPIAKDKLNPKDLQKDSFALMAAGIIYGENTSTKGMNLGDIHRANNELHGMAIMLAELSASAANLLGFRFVDENVEKGVKYYYAANIVGDEKYGSSIEIKNELIEVREPYQFRVDTGDNYLRLVWSKDYNKRQFSFYWIERSENNKDFYPILERPLMMFETDVSEQAPVFDYVDSFNIVNNQIYYYKFYGGTSFAEYTKPALASGMPRDMTPPTPPQLQEVTYADSTKSFILEWDFNLDELPEDLDYYQIMTSRTEEGPFIPLGPKLGLQDVGYIHEINGPWDESNEGRHYFRIDCYDYNGNESNTQTTMAIVPDFTNPMTPDEFTGYIDSLGLVRLKWNKSSSKDVSGYWLYWSNDPNAEFSLVKQEMISDTQYVYYIPEKSLNKYIYYTLRAEDYNYNRSDAFPVIRVKKLDKIAPIMPTIAKINNDSCRIKLFINLSPSDDVFINEIYRKNTTGPDTSWSKITSIGHVNNFIDTSALIGVNYQYKLLAIDSTGNKSDFSPVKSAIRSIDKKLAVISDLKIGQKVSTNQVELNWNFIEPKNQPNTNYSYILYRSTGNDGVKYFETISNKSPVFFDTKTKPGVVYNYAVQIKSDDGWTGPLSEIKSILIK